MCWILMVLVFRFYSILGKQMWIISFIGIEYIWPAHKKNLFYIH